MSAKPGQQMVLVDTSEYGWPGTHWCSVDYIKEGDGSPYPIVVRLNEGQLGQFKFTEVLESRWTR